MEERCSATRATQKLEQKIKLLLKLKNMITRQEFDKKYKVTPHYIGLELNRVTLFHLIEKINVYLNSFDYYIKNELEVSCYRRYLDDFFIIDTSQERLKEIKKKCFTFLKKQEGLQVHLKKKYLQHYSKGFQLLGVCIKPYRIYIAKRTKTAFKKVVFFYAIFLENQILKSAKEINLLRSVVNSYLGILTHIQTYKLRYQTIYSMTSSSFYKYSYFDSAIKRFKIYKSLTVSSNQ